MDLYIDWSQMKTAIEMFKIAIGLVKDIKKELPEGEKKEAITKSIAEAEKASKLAQVQIAQALGYNLCQCSFPPEIMLSIGRGTRNEHFKCPKCGKTISKLLKK